MGYETGFLGMLNVSPPADAAEQDVIRSYGWTYGETNERGFAEGVVARNHLTWSQLGVPEHVSTYPDGRRVVLYGADEQADESDVGITTDGEWLYVGEPEGSYGKYYHAAEWMRWVVGYLVGRGHAVRGEILAHGEQADDLWRMRATGHRLFIDQGRVVYEES